MRLNMFFLLVYFIMSLVAYFSGGGTTISGSVVFTNDTNSVKIDLNIKGLTPNTTYGFHIHNNYEVSNCLYCPYSCAHYPSPGTTVGVLQNLQGDSLGEAKYTFYDLGSSLASPKKGGLALAPWSAPRGGWVVVVGWWVC